MHPESGSEASPTMLRLIAALLLFTLLIAFQAVTAARAQPAVPGAAAQGALSSGGSSARSDVPLVRIGGGDEVKFSVYGQPDMDTVLYVSDDGSVTIPLAGQVKIGGLSPTEAAEELERALRNGNFLVNPHVTLTVAQSRSQRVSVLGEVRSPGRYPIDSSTTIFDLLAQAGGTTVEGASTIFLLRQDKDGKVNRYPINLRGFGEEKFTLPFDVLMSGDSIYVPRADQFYIFGEVSRPGMYSMEPDMTVLQAIAKAGGITPRGSSSRIEVKRQVSEKKQKTFSVNLTEQVKPDDVIQVKESIF